MEDERPWTDAELQAMEEAKKKKDPKKKDKKTKVEEEEENTKFDKKEKPKRIITYVIVGFRIYCKKGKTSNKKDENSGAQIFKRGVKKGYLLKWLYPRSQ